MNPLFSPHVQKVLQLAATEAQRVNSEMIGTGHVLLAMIRDSEGMGYDGLINFECDIELARLEVAKLVEPALSDVAGKLPLNLATKKAVEHALLLANNETVTPLHLLIGILQDDDAVATRLLTRLGISTVDVLSDAHAAITTEQGCIIFRKKAP